VFGAKPPHPSPQTLLFAANTPNNCERPCAPTTSAEFARPPSTAKELLEAWPSDADTPSLGTLYEWLNHAHAKKLVRREGHGTNVKPWRYRLPNQDDAYYDMGELPPMRLE
jgi:hypothetical protein